MMEKEQFLDVIRQYQEFQNIIQDSKKCINNNILSKLKENFKVVFLYSLNIKDEEKLEIIFNYLDYGYVIISNYDLWGISEICIDSSEKLWKYIQYD